MNQFQENQIAVMARVILFTGERLGQEVVQDIPPALDGLISERDAERRRADVAAADANDAEAEVNKVSELLAKRTAELASANADKEAYAQNAIDLRNRVDALQQRLAAADERVAVLETALRKIKVRLDAYSEADMRMPEPSVEVCQMIAEAALKPVEGGGDEA